ncbi:DUF1801 domain-containing protein [Eionea flava]
MDKTMDSGVKKKFESYPDYVRPKLNFLRQLILDEAAKDKSIGILEETLKWGEPSYLTTVSKSGTTLRIDWKSKAPNEYAIYVNCKTTLIDTFRSLFPELTYEGNRAIVFNIDQTIPENEVRLCINMALKYHLNKNI